MGFLAIALFSFLLSIAAFRMPDGARLAIRALDLIVVQIIGNCWITLRVTSQVMTERQNKKWKGVNTAQFKSFLWIAILSGLATIGGSIFFILPGIWLYVALAFAPYLFLDENLTGRQALVRSAKLVKGRWWSTVTKLVLAGVPFMVVGMLAGSLIEWIVSLIAGYSPSSVIDLTTNGLPAMNILGTSASYVATNALQVINTIPFIVLTPFLIHLMVTVYQELKRTNA